MLNGGSSFEEQTNDSQVFRGPCVAVPGENANRSIIPTWEPSLYSWEKSHFPCLHSDPELSELAADRSGHPSGWVSSDEANDIDEGLKRIEGTGWGKDRDAE